MTMIEVVNQNQLSSKDIKVLKELKHRNFSEECWNEAQLASEKGDANAAQLWRKTATYYEGLSTN